MSTGDVIALEEHPLFRFQGSAGADKGQNGPLFIDANDMQRHRIDSTEAPALAPRCLASTPRLLPW